MSNRQVTTNLQATAATFNLQLSTSNLRLSTRDLQPVTCNPQLATNNEYEICFHKQVLSAAGDRIHHPFVWMAGEARRIRRAPIRPFAG
jgi:hypothetical protein